MVLVLCFSIIFVGCNNSTPKAPDNFDKDLWEDSVKVIRVIYSTYDADNNFSVEDEKIIKQYFDTYKNRQYDNIKENKLIRQIDELYETYGRYIFAKKADLNLQTSHKQDCKQMFDNLQNQYDGLIK